MSTEGHMHTCSVGQVCLYQKRRSVPGLITWDCNVERGMSTKGQAHVQSWPDLYWKRAWVNHMRLQRGKRDELESSGARAKLAGSISKACLGWSHEIAKWKEGWARKFRRTCKVGRIYIESVPGLITWDCKVEKGMSSKGQAHVQSWPDLYRKRAWVDHMRLQRGKRDEHERSGTRAKLATIVCMQKTYAWRYMWARCPQIKTAVRKHCVHGVGT